MEIKKQLLAIDLHHRLSKNGTVDITVIGRR